MSASAVGIICAQRGCVSLVFRHPNGVEDGLQDVVVLLGGRSRCERDTFTLICKSALTHENARVAVFVDSLGVTRVRRVDQK
jgi:hypothetical protein